MDRNDAKAISVRQIAVAVTRGTACRRRTEPSLAPLTAGSPNVQTRLPDFLARDRNFMALDNKTCMHSFG
jgi:hypothetical protein